MRVGGVRLPLGIRLPAVGPRLPISGFQFTAGANARIKTTVYHVFNRDVIRRNWKDLNRLPLAKAGNYIRRVAIWSIRKDNRKGKFGKPSPPGRAPFSRFPGHPMRLIYSVPETSKVTVGPVGFGSHVPVTAIHEFGLSRSRRVTRTAGHGRSFMVRSTGHERVRYPKRPYMAPALNKAVAQHKLPPMWSGSLRSH